PCAAKPVAIAAGSAMVRLALRLGVIGALRRRRPLLHLLLEIAVIVLGRVWRLAEVGPQLLADIGLRRCARAAADGASAAAERRLDRGDARLELRHLAAAVAGKTGRSLDLLVVLLLALLELLLLLDLLELLVLLEVLLLELLVLILVLVFFLVL